MKIVDLTDEHKQLYCVCLEDWSEEMKEAGNHKEVWYNSMKEKGLRVKLALDDSGQVGGMIQYLPVEYSFVEGKNLYFILCIWVHGYKKGRGNFQKKGMGTALLQAAEEDAKSLGTKGIAAWGIPLPFWMKASWFKKHGYIKADQNGFLGEVLLWKPFSDDAAPPRLVHPKKKPGTVSGKVTVTAFVDGWCPGMNMTYERVKRAASDFGDEVEFRKTDTLDREIFKEWGISGALYIDDREVNIGPPPSYEKIKKRIAKQVKKL